MAYGKDENDNARHYGATGSASDDSPSYCGVSIGNPDPIREQYNYRSFVTPAYLRDPLPTEPLPPRPHTMRADRESALERIADALEKLLKIEQDKAKPQPFPQFYYTINTGNQFDYSAEDEEPELPETLTVGADDAVFVAAEDYWDQTPAMRAVTPWRYGMLTKTDGRYPAGLTPYYTGEHQKGYFYQVSDEGLHVLGIERQ